MRRKRLDGMDCSIAKALDVVGDPWTMLILRDALLGVRRFESFSTRLAIPRATLSARLDDLCERDVLERRSYAARPGRVEYVLTEKGRALRPVVVTLMQWGDQWMRHDDPPTIIVDSDTGAVVDPVLVDRATGVPLDAMRVHAVGPVVDGVDRGRDTAL
ncbi:MAG: winged helix-turn-helix transcriptional regulator [Ilumatobacteraceae bacterium]